MDEARLQQLRDTAWTRAGYLYWQRGDPDERKQAVWREHKRTGLDETLRVLVEMVGPPRQCPPRSACWMCPFRTDHEWSLMKRESPEDFQNAVRFEKEVQQKDPHVWLHKSCKPISEVEFTEEPDLFAKPCDSGHCFT